jgi:peptidyl-prolyl cis-trans isomerase SurA
MKIRSILTVIILFLFQPSGFSQEPDEKTLMTIEGRKVEAGEFIRMYNKILDPSMNSDLNDYLEQFIEFKLKVAEAIDQGYDTTRAFRDELNGYRNQLAQNYLTDPEVKEKLLQKAFQRSLIEVNASHVLVSCPPDVPAEDTIKAYKKAIDIRERIIKGEIFEQVAKATSDDKSVLINGGNLGYFTVFQMITPFEEAAYNLKTGTLSMPVRTPYGYHIIRVSDKRPSKGKIKVAHIMKTAPPGSNEEAVSKAEKEINSIYTRLNNGESFRRLAAENSDHKESAAHGGELNWFGTGEIISDFSEAAFSIKDTGDYTGPFRSAYGFHIIKLLDKRPPGTFEESKSYLESKLNQSNLISAGKKSFIDKLKKEYNFRINNTVYNWFVKNTDTLITSGVTKYKRENIPAGDIYSYAEKHLQAQAFADYLESRGNMVITKNPKLYIDTSIESILADDIMKYEDSVLEKKYPDFKYLMLEFHDGILLFDISSKRVWNKAQDDSTGLQDFYISRKNEYLSEKSIEAKIYTLRESGGEERLYKTYKKYSRKPDCDERLKREFNQKGDTLLSISEGKWFAGDDKDIDSIKWVKGIHSVSRNGFPALIDIKRVNTPEPLPFKEVQAEINSDYQEWLTEEWIKQLKAKYAVKVDNLVFNEVKNRLGNE